jgi:NTE family protein
MPRAKRLPPREPRCADGSRRRALAAVGAGGATALLAGSGLGACTFAPDADHSGEDAPRFAPLARTPRVAWVFSSGGPRGFTHVGVLRALHEMGLAPDLIVGASAGALVGALRASGVEPQAIETMALELQPVGLARIALGATERFSGAPVAELVRRHALVQRLERMPIAMACVASRQRDGQVIAFTAGDAGVAVQASAAIEGQFAPVRIRGETYVDADWHQPLPVRLARSLGARIVLAVDATVHVDRAPPGAERYREGDRRKKALVDADAAVADLVLKPDFGYWVSLSRDFRERAIGAGYRDTMVRERELRALHRA